MENALSKKRVEKNYRLIWQGYRGAIRVSRWAVPASRQHCHGMMMSLGYFWERIKVAELYWPDLIVELQEMVRPMRELLASFDGQATKQSRLLQRRRALFDFAFYDLLQEIENFQLAEGYAEARLEIRYHEPANCSLCGVDLIWPAHIRYANGKMSASIGVQCLEHCLGQLEVLVKALTRSMPVQIS